MTDAIATQQGTGGLPERPDFIKKGGMAGREHITSNDVKLPRLALAQSTHAQVQEGDPAQIEGLRPGMYFNDLTGVIYGKGPLQFVPIIGYPPKGIEFAPRSEGGGIVDRDVPLNDPRMQFTKDPETGKSVKPVATKFYDFVIYLVETQELVALSFAGMGLKVATTLYGYIQGRDADIYTGLYTIESKPAKAAGGPYQAHVVKNFGWVTPEENVEKMKSMHDGLLGKNVDLGHERAAGADDGAGEGDTSFDPEKLERGGM